MADPRALLDAYAEAETCECESGVGHTFSRSGASPKTVAALRAVLDKHQQTEFKHLPITWCTHCAQAETGAMVEWPCPTVQAITNALEADHG